jgi:hypothetical protein
MIKKSLSLFFLLFLISCEGDQIDKSALGVSDDAATQLMRGELSGAINSHLVAPTPPCPARVEAPIPTYSPLPRPKASQSESVRNRHCRARARQSKQLGINKLIVGFEGLGSFSQSSADSFYQNYDLLHRGQRIDPNLSWGLSSHMTRHLLAPNLQRSYLTHDFLLFSERGGAEALKSCIAIYRQEIGPAFELTIMGISYGAGEAMVLANSLADRTAFPPQGITVSNLVTFDLRGSPRAGGVGPRTRMHGPFQTPPNVQRHQNFGRFSASELFPISPSLGFPGYRAQPSRAPGSVTVNTQVPASAGHTNQLKRTDIQNFYRSLLSQ